MRVGNFLNYKINNCWSKIWSYTPSAAFNTVTVSGLDGDTHAIYRLILYTVGVSTSNDSVNIRFNGDTGNNYGYKVVGMTSGTTLAYSATTATSGLLAGQFRSTTGSFFDIIIYAKSGRERIGHAQSWCGATVSAINSMYDSFFIWSNTANNLTSMTIYGTISNNMATGCRFVLYARRQG